MPYSYPLEAKVLSEFVAMTLTIFLGESVIANELLPSTKGHGMGYLGVSLGFGLAFGVNIAWFGFISAVINPATFFFLALIGKVGWIEFLACSCADFVGAFFGAVLVAFFFLPHFNFTLPLPTNSSDIVDFLEGPVIMDRNAGRLASAFGPASRNTQNKTIRQELRTFFSLPKDEHFLTSTKLGKGPTSTAYAVLLEKMEMRHRRRREKATHFHTAGLTRAELFRHNSVNLADAILHPKDVKDMAPSPDTDLRHSIQVAGLLHAHYDTSLKELGVDTARRHSIQLDDHLRTHDDDNVKEIGTLGHSETNTTNIITTSDGSNKCVDDAAANDKEVESPQDQPFLTMKPKAADSMENEAVNTAYQAVLQADASAKLSIFATRPAIFNRPYNFLQEALLTAALVLGAELFSLRQEMQVQATGAPFEDGPYVVALFIGLYITMLILGLGGVTALAANPARDFGPRLAHYLLPLPGKGSSEWNYGLVVPFWGPFTGAALAAGIYNLIEALFGMIEIEEE